MSRPRWGRRVEVNVGEERGFKYFFLAPEQTANGLEETSDIVLSLYPADTLAQARRLYPRLDRRARTRLARLDAAAGWSVRPHFHVGVLTRGLVHDRSPADIATYLAYWSAHLDRYGQRTVEQWPSIIKELAAEGIVSSGYRQAFRQGIGGYKTAYPCPGIQIRRSWAVAEAERLDRRGEFVGEVRRSIDRALECLGEDPLTTTPRKLMPRG